MTRNNKMDNNRFHNLTPVLVCWTLLSILIISAVILRLGLVDVPLQRDEGEYAYAGQLILNGTLPYKEVHNMKLPGIYAAYACILKVFGETHQGIHFALIIINGITGFFIFLMARNLLDRTAALSAVSIFLILSAGRYIQGIYANAEHFVILFATIGLYLLIINRERKRLRFFLSGLILGIAFIMKQHGAVFLLFGSVYIVFLYLAVYKNGWKEMVKQLVFFIIGGVCPYLVVCCIFFAAGAFDDFWFWTIDYARTYVSQTPLNSAWDNLYFSSIYILKDGRIAWLIIGIGAILIPFAKIENKTRWFLGLFALFSIIAIMPGFFFRPHYFILILPAASLLSGLGISQISKLLIKFKYIKKRQHVACALLVLFIIGESLLLQKDYFFRFTPFQVTRELYGENPFHESLKVADYIQTHSDKDDPIAVLGSEPQIFFYSGRRSASGFIYMYPLMEKHNFALEMQKKFVSDIESEKPKFLIFINVPASWLSERNSHSYIFQWLERYQENLELVGTVELYKDHSDYNWKPRQEWLPVSKDWIAVFKDRRI